MGRDKGGRGGEGDSGLCSGLLLSARGGLAPPSSSLLGPSAPLVTGVVRLMLEFSSCPGVEDRPLEGVSETGSRGRVGEVGVFLPEETGGPELVGGVRGDPGRPRPPRGPCSMDRLHWLSTSSFMLDINPRAVGSKPPIAPGIRGCLRGPPNPGKLAGPPRRKWNSEIPDTLQKSISPQFCSTIWRRI